MQFKVIFKGVEYDGKYKWENCLDVSPKQMVCDKNPVVNAFFPKKNQQYNIRCKKLKLNEMVGIEEITDHYVTCNYWKIEKGELVFKKSKNKGLTVKQYTSSFPFNTDEERRFVKSLSAIYKKINNIYTRNNVIQIFNSGAIKYCEIFGYGESVILSGNYKGKDMLTISKWEYKGVKNRLEFFAGKVISPITQKNCESWIKYLDNKFS